MSRLSHRAWSKGSARGAGPVRQKGTVRVRDARETSAFLRMLKTRRMCKAHGMEQARCDDCGAYHCPAPGHMKHRCGLQPEVCAACWQGYYVGPGEPPHVCRRDAP